MKITDSFEINKSEFVDLYRIHIKYKFKLHRSMIMSVLLFAFGMFMEYGMNMKFNFINNFVFCIMIIAILLNLISDFYLPKTAYNNLINNGMNKGKLELNDCNLIFVFGKVKDENEWSSFDSCIETDNAFVIYKKDKYTFLFKKSLNNQIDIVRILLRDKVNRGKEIPIKK